MRIRVLAGIIPLCVLTPMVAAAAPTGAAANAGSVDNLLSLFGILSYSYSDNGIGLGARFQKTIVSNVVFKDQPTLKDDFGVEFGLDYLHYDFGQLGYDWTYNELVLIAGGTWNVWLNDKLAVYPKIDIGYRFGSGSVKVNGVEYSGGKDDFVGQAAAGVIYKLYPFALRAEIGTWSLRLGAGFQF